jgi:hypothetical protein
MEHKSRVEMDEETWLAALEGRCPDGMTGRDRKEVEHLRRVLESRHAFLHDLAAGGDEYDIGRIRARLQAEGLMHATPSASRQQRWPLSVPWGIGFSLALAGLVMLVIHAGFTPMGVSTGQREVDVVRGQEQAAVLQLFPDEVLAGSRVQMVGDVAQALLAWEADLVAAGMEYQVEAGGRTADVSADRRLHIRLSDRIRYLGVDHQRVLAAVPQAGEWVLVLRRAGAGDSTE